MDGKRFGRGMSTYASGDTYEGGFDDGKEGHGVFRYHDGDVYIGEFHLGKRHGPGTKWDRPENTASVRQYVNGEQKGAAVVWSADRLSATKFMDGRRVGPISLEEADEIAASIGLTMPPVGPPPGPPPLLRQRSYGNKSYGTIESGRLQIPGAESPPVVDQPEHKAVPRLARKNTVEEEAHDETPPRSPSRGPANGEMLFTSQKNLLNGALLEAA